MIDTYLEEKAQRIAKETLLAWRDFYTQCNNDWLVKKVDKQLSKL